MDYVYLCMASPTCSVLAWVLCRDGAEPSLSCGRLRWMWHNQVLHDQARQWSGIEWPCEILNQARANVKKALRFAPSLKWCLLVTYRDIESSNGVVCKDLPVSYDHLKRSKMFLPTFRPILMTHVTIPLFIIGYHDDGRGTLLPN